MTRLTRGLLQSLLTGGVLLAAAGPAMALDPDEKEIEVLVYELEADRLDLQISVEKLVGPTWVTTQHQNVPIPFDHADVIFPGFEKHYYDVTLDGLTTGQAYRGRIEWKNPATGNYEFYRDYPQWTQ
jgi:hypothetical protein